MRVRVLLTAAFSSLALLAAAFPSLLPPNQELLPNDATQVGKRTSRKAQRPRDFRQYYGVEYADYPVPDDYAVPGEWVFARFMYRAVYGWRGERMANWTIDYPRSDRHLSAAVRRLTQIQARSVEQPVAAEDDDD